MERLAFWLIQIPGWLLFAYLVIAQCTAAFNYQLGVRMGTQEPAEQITKVGVALFRGYASADLVYASMLGLGLIGHVLGQSWATLVLGAALGITIYWPIACLATVKAARDAPGWSLPKEQQYWIVLPAIATWGAMGIILLWMTI